MTGPNLGEVVITLNSAGIAAAQRWINDPGSNYGVVFQDFENANTDDLDFASSEAKVAQTRPKLSLSVSPAPAITAQSFSSTTLRNSINPFDVDNNGTVSPIDVLVVFNVLNRRAEGESAKKSAEAYADVSGDGVVSPTDALLVINYLTRIALGAAGEGSDSGMDGPIAVPMPSDDDEFWSIELEAIMGHLAAERVFRGNR
jgi:hypothetical protein